MEDTMRKEEFLRQLEQLLSCISEEERADAMAYYRSYFEDAGVENEASILEELESPEKVAQSILKDLGIVAESGGSTRSGNKSGNEEQRGYGSSGSGYGSSRGGYGSSQGSYGSSQGGYGSSGSGYGSSQGGYGSSRDGYGSSQGGYGSSRDGYGYSSYGGYEEQNRQKNRTIGIIVTVIALVVLSPVWLAVLGTVFGLLVGIVGALFGIVVAAIAVMGSLLFAGFVLVGTGFGAVFSGSVAGGIAVIGIGFLLLSVGILAVILTVWVIGTFVPWAWKGITDCLGKLWNKGREKKRL